MANFKKTGDLYVDKSNPNASDANAGTDPDLPKLTIQGAYDVATAGDIIVIGDGLYSESNLTGGDFTLEGDGIVICQGNISDAFVSIGQCKANNIIFIDYLWISQVRSVIYNNCIFFNCQSLISIGGSGATTISECKFVNSIAGRGGHLTNLIKCILINSTYQATNDSSNAINCYFDDSSIIEINTTQTGIFKFNSILGTINDGSQNLNLTSAKSTYPSVFENNNQQYQAKFNRVTGESLTLDFSVKGDSELLLNGEFGQNIGGVKRGIESTRFSDSVQNGTITNLVFDGQTWRVQDGFTTGTLETAVIDFGLTVKSPKPNIKGTINYLDNVPDFDNLLRDPNKCDFEVRYAIIGEDISAKAYKTFLYNEQLLLDNTGKSTGEAGFDWNNTVTIPMKEIQYRITLRQDFND